MNLWWWRIFIFFRFNKLIVLSLGKNQKQIILLLPDGILLNALFHNWSMFSIIQHIILCNFLCSNRTNWIANKKNVFFSRVNFFKCSGWAHVRGLIRRDFSRFKLNGLQFDLFLPREELCCANKRKIQKCKNRSEI